MNAVNATARAKINLALHVTARRADGYHELDSLVAFAEVGDKINVASTDRITLGITGPFAGQLSMEPGNIVTRAAQAMCRAWPQDYAPVAIELTKNLPVASGIGGGSADAAATLFAMQELYGPAPDQQMLAEIALQLGADVPVCTMGKACRMRGIGDELHPLTSPPVLAAVLVNPGTGVSTPQVFDELGLAPGQTAKPPMSKLPSHADPADWIAWLAECRNDLQAPAIALVPEIETVLGVINSTPGCLLHRMSGSGATCFGLYADQNTAQQAANQISAGHPGWWICPTTIR